LLSFLVVQKKQMHRGLQLESWLLLRKAGSEIILFKTIPKNLGGCKITGEQSTILALNRDRLFEGMDS
jgi:hypothetical protein